MLFAGVGMLTYISQMRNSAEWTDATLLANSLIKEGSQMSLQVVYEPAP